MKKIDYNSFYGKGSLDFSHLVRYEEPSISLFWNERKMLFLSHLKKLEGEIGKLNILDVGSSFGKTLFELYHYEKQEHNYWGLDIHKEGINFSKKYSSKFPLRFQFKIQDITKPGWGKELNKKFDLIIFSEVIEHLYPEDQEIVLRELSTLLSPKGILIITCPNKACLIKKIIHIGQRISPLRKYISTLGEFNGLEGHVGEPTFSELKKMTYEFKLIEHRGLTFTYGHEKIGRSTSLMILVLLLNKVFGALLPFWAFDQYIILKNKKN
ncbi:methyltransferase domain-containing protein [Candidatus Pacearchaeota archaeon]|jgi:SAM-dependent methyltransferase|nr:methyltransferase domain-containing protein [Candidatus Pacearchaeota archaeon]